MTEDRLLLWAVVAALVIHLLLPGCGEPYEPMCSAGEQQYIIDGEPSVDRRSTVYVQTVKGMCTGTIVGPHTVLTAAHCDGVTDISVDQVGWFEAVDELQHPEYNFPRHDLLLAYFDEPLPGPYAELGTLPLSCSVLIAQGYGQGSGGELHERTVVDHTRTAGTIFAGESTCYGDSGGGLWAAGFHGDVLVGVASFGLNGDCIGGVNGWVDLTTDGHPEWLAENIR